MKRLAAALTVFVVVMLSVSRFSPPRITEEQLRTCCDAVASSAGCQPARQDRPRRVALLVGMNTFVERQLAGEHSARPLEIYFVVDQTCSAQHSISCYHVVASARTTVCFFSNLIDRKHDSGIESDASWYSRVLDEWHMWDDGSFVVFDDGCSGGAVWKLEVGVKGVKCCALLANSTPGPAVPAPVADESIRSLIARMTTMARAFTANAHAANDIVQNALLAILLAASRAGRTQISWGYVRAAVRSATFKYFRKEANARRAGEAVARPEAVFDEPRCRGAPDTERVRRAFDRLKAGHREILWWRFYEGRPVTEIAARLGVSHDAAYQRVCRALDSLKNVGGFEPANAR
jgi:RNA polymerase sigma factor (sigma-70 family)